MNEGPQKIWINVTAEDFPNIKYRQHPPFHYPFIPMFNESSFDLKFAPDQPHGVGVYELALKLSSNPNDISAVVSFHLNEDGTIDYKGDRGKAENRVTVTDAGDYWWVQIETPMPG